MRHVISMSTWETVYVPRHLSSLARSCPATFQSLLSIYHTMSTPTNHGDSTEGPTDIFSTSLAASTVHPSLLNINSSTVDSAVVQNAPTIRKHPTSFYGHKLTTLPAPMHNTTGVFLRDDIIFLADAEGNTVTVSVPEMKMCLRFHSVLAKTKFQTNAPGTETIVEPASYRVAATFLNGDPMIWDKLVVIEDNGNIIIPAYKEGYRPYALRFDYPDPRLIRDA